MNVKHSDILTVNLITNTVFYAKKYRNTDNVYTNTTLVLGRVVVSSNLCGLHLSV